MNKQPEITDKTRTAFINVFCNLYQEKPIEKISVQEITRMAGYNRSTFYQYFTDIYDLLEYIEKDVLDHMRNEMAPKFSEGKLNDSFVKHFAELYEEKEEYLTALLGDYGNVRFMEKIKREMTRNLLQNGIHFKDNVFVPYVIECSLSIVLAAFRHWHRNGKNVPSDELIHFISDLLRRGPLALMQQYIGEG